MIAFFHQTLVQRLVAREFHLEFLMEESVTAIPARAYGPRTLAYCSFLSRCCLRACQCRIHLHDADTLTAALAGSARASLTQQVSHHAWVPDASWSTAVMQPEQSAMVSKRSLELL